MGKRKAKKKSNSVNKTNSYLSRYQVKFARRRAGALIFRCVFLRLKRRERGLGGEEKMRTLSDARNGSRASRVSWERAGCVLGCFLCGIRSFYREVRVRFCICGRFFRARAHFFFSSLLFGSHKHPSFFRVYMTCPDPFYFYSSSS